MIEFGGITYYIDVDAFDAAIALTGSENIVSVHERKTLNKEKDVIETKVFTTTNTREREINSSRYEILRTMLEVIVDYSEDFDVSLGIDRALEASNLGFKLAFNTLIKYGILKEAE